MTIVILAAAVTLLAQAPAPGAAAQLSTATGTLAGTLVVPPAAGKVPVVLIIAGSGPTDRDGNSTLIAGQEQHLQDARGGARAEGIASLRYDKRGIGREPGRRRP